MAEPNNSWSDLDPAVYLIYFAMVGWATVIGWKPGQSVAQEMGRPIASASR